MPSLGVETAVVDAGKVLLIKRRDFRVWALPGGAVDAGESLAEAAVREAREETGLEVELTHLVGLYSRPAWCDDGDHDVLFAARIVGGALVRENDEVIGCDFFAPHELPEPLVSWHAQRIRDTLAGSVGLACSQHTPWPFDPSWSLGDVRRKVAAGEIKMEELLALFGPHYGGENALEVSGAKQG